MPTASSPEVAARMSRQASGETTQELAVRRLLHRRGMRYRIHLPVPGMPRRRIDVAFPGPRVAVFLDGCFWHSCPDHATAPRTNSAWWRSKLDRNRARDRETTQHLESEGWLVLRFWEHEDTEAIADRVTEEVRARRTP